METSATPAVTIGSSPGLTPRLLRHGAGRETSPTTARSAATGRSTDAGRAARRGRPVGCSGVAVRLPARGQVCARSATTAAPPAAPSSSPTAKRASPRRSRTGGCCGTARTWCSTGCGWPHRWSAPTAPTSTSPIALGAQRRRALAELDRTCLGGLTVAVLTVEPGYVAGEETAAVRALNGGPAKPTDKPPRPFEEGVGGLPTMVSNVETLANLPYLHRHGSAAFRAGHVDVAGHVPRDDHRRRQPTRAVRNSARPAHSPNCSSCTAFRPTRCAAC